MPCLPSRFAGVILNFAPLFRQWRWQHAEVLLIGAIWPEQGFVVSRRAGNVQKLQPAPCCGIVYTPCHAA